MAKKACASGDLGRLGELLPDIDPYERVVNGSLINQLSVFDIVCFFDRRGAARIILQDRKLGQKPDVIEKVISKWPDLLSCILETEISELAKTIIQKCDLSVLASVIRDNPILEAYIPDHVDALALEAPNPERTYDLFIEMFYDGEAHDTVSFPDVDDPSYNPACSSDVFFM